ncbi:rRNA maturation RNase YbeY [Entomobacter blattae]|uniref:Endoribonuclease YbeY n=1 Tax=Entomobacter blattae TaxID=2762277 RepID=A0A7H1NTG1_9PROT|nr:rRNA maturation RNase YbeY [Entomobacter blattae]QNT79071.1 Endoribonuclease YbeY [Entomobacter blattae]
MPTLPYLPAAYTVNGYNILIQNKSWLKPLSRASRLVQRMTQRTGGKGNIVFADDYTLQKLNHTFRKKNKPTNVLTFESPHPFIGGDIVLSFETLKKESSQQRKPFLHHTAHILVHALLHLQGYDHLSAGEARIMEMQEILLLSYLGIPNPWKPRQFYEDNPRA